MSDDALARHIGEFIRHHRMAQQKTQDELSRDAGISRSTLSLLERGAPVTLASFLQVLRVLDQLHVLDAFEVKEQVSPLTLARLQKKMKRTRVRSKGGKSQESETDW